MANRKKKQLCVYVDSSIAADINKRAGQDPGGVSGFIGGLIGRDLYQPNTIEQRGAAILEFLQIVTRAQLERDDPAFLDEMLKAHRARMA